MSTTPPDPRQLEPIEGTVRSTGPLGSTVDGWGVDAILGKILTTRSTYAIISVGELRAASYVLLATHQSPHFDIVLPTASEQEAGRLLSLFGKARANPHRSRRI